MSGVYIALNLNLQQKMAELGKQTTDFNFELNQDDIPMMDWQTIHNPRLLPTVR